MFDLRIAITPQSLDRLKKSLLAVLPEVKSSHRLEAAARGLGFRTYAALLVATESAEPILAEVSPTDFSHYLANHDVGTEPEKLYHVVANALIRSVMTEQLGLTSFGIGLGPLRVSRTDPKEIHVGKFNKGRAALLTERSACEFLLSLSLIKMIDPIKTINPNTTSYKLKHIAENFRCDYPTGQKLGPIYVANGSFIAAAIHAGHKFRSRHDSLNAVFNMSQKSIVDLDCEIRPDGVSARDRRRKKRLRELSVEYHIPIRDAARWGWA